MALYRLDADIFRQTRLDRISTARLEFVRSNTPVLSSVVYPAVTAGRFPRDDYGTVYEYAMAGDTHLRLYGEARRRSGNPNAGTDAVTLNETSAYAGFTVSGETPFVATVQLVWTRAVYGADAPNVTDYLAIGWSELHGKLRRTWEYDWVQIQYDTWLQQHPQADATTKQAQLEFLRREYSRTSGLPIRPAVPLTSAEVQAMTAFLTQRGLPVDAAILTGVKMYLPLEHYLDDLLAQDPWMSVAHKNALLTMSSVYGCATQRDQQQAEFAAYTVGPFDLIYDGANVQVSKAVNCQRDILARVEILPFASTHTLTEVYQVRTGTSLVGMQGTPAILESRRTLPSPTHVLRVDVAANGIPPASPPYAPRDPIPPGLCVSASSLGRVTVSSALAASIESAVPRIVSSGPTNQSVRLQDGQQLEVSPRLATGTIESGDSATLFDLTWSGGDFTAAITVSLDLEGTRETTTVRISVVDNELVLAADAAICLTSTQIRLSVVGGPGRAAIRGEFYAISVVIGDSPTFYPVECSIELETLQAGIQGVSRTDWQLSDLPSINVTTESGTQISVSTLTSTNSSRPTVRASDSIDQAAMGVHLAAGTRPRNLLGYVLVTPTAPIRVDQTWSFDFTLIYRDIRRVEVRYRMRLQQAWYPPESPSADTRPGPVTLNLLEGSPQVPLRFSLFTEDPLNPTATGIWLVARLESGASTGGPTSPVNCERGNRLPVVTVPAVMQSDVGVQLDAMRDRVTVQDPDGTDFNSITVAGLPPGIEIQPWQASVSGKPVDFGFRGAVTTAGTYQVTVTAVDLDGGVGTGSFTWTVVVPPGGVIERPLLTNPGPRRMRVGESVSYQLAATRGKPPYRFVVLGLSHGLSYAEDGLVSGVPTTTLGFRHVLYLVEDANRQTDAIRSYINIVGSADPPLFWTTTTHQLQLGRPFSLQLLTHASDADPLTFSGGTLPPGVTMTSGGLVHGTPTQIGTFTGSITVANARNSTNSSQSFIWMVVPATAGDSPPGYTAPVSPDGHLSGKVGQELVLQLFGVDAEGPVTYRAVGLPPGILIGSDGLLYGWYSAAGNFVTRVFVIDSAQQETEQIIYFSVTDGTPGSGDLTVVTTVVSTATTIKVTELPPPPGEIVAVGVPPGMTHSVPTGSLVGAPTSVGSYGVTVAHAKLDGTYTTKKVLVVVTTEPPPPPPPGPTPIIRLRRRTTTG